MIWCPELVAKAQMSTLKRKCFIFRKRNSENPDKITLLRMSTIKYVKIRSVQLSECNFFYINKQVLGPNILKWFCPTSMGHLRDGTQFPISSDWCTYKRPGTCILSTLSLLNLWVGSFFIEIDELYSLHYFVFIQILGSAWFFLSLYYVKYIVICWKRCPFYIDASSCSLIHLRYCSFIPLL